MLNKSKVLDFIDSQMQYANLNHLYPLYSGMKELKEYIESGMCDHAIVESFSGDDIAE